MASVVPGSGTREGQIGQMQTRPSILGELLRERKCCSGGRADLPRPGLPLQRLYSMDLRSSHKAKGKEKLCFSLWRAHSAAGAPRGWSRRGAGGTAELVEKGPLVPTLPFPLRKPHKAHKYLRLSRKKFPPRGPSWRVTAIHGSSSCRSQQPQMSCRPPETGSLWSSPLRRRVRQLS